MLRIAQTAFTLAIGAVLAVYVGGNVAHAVGEAFANINAVLVGI